MGSKYEYLYTKIHIDKKSIVKIAKTYRYIFLNCRHRDTPDTLFFRVLFSPDTLIVFLRFHKSFNYGTVVGFLYYQISHYGSFNVRGGVSRADHRGGGEGLVLEENNTTQKVPNSGAKHPNHVSVYVRRCIFDVILLNFITLIISLIACPSKISHTGRK